MINPNDFQLPQDPAEVPQESPVERMERWERESAAETQAAANQGVSKANAALDKMLKFEDEAQQVHEENRNFYEEESKDIQETRSVSLWIITAAPKPGTKRLIRHSRDGERRGRDSGPGC